MATKESFRVEWTDSGPESGIKIKSGKEEMVIQKGRETRVYVRGGKVAIRQGRRVKGVELLKMFDHRGANLLPRHVPEETLIFTHNSPRCVNIPTRNGWIRW